MIYDAYQARDDFLLPVRAFAEMAAAGFRMEYAGPIGNLALRAAAAGAELVARSRLLHVRPDFGIKTVRVAGADLEVVEDAALKTPFGTLLHFRKIGGPAQPRVLLVAPMAGHFATLLRDTVRTVLPDHDVFITDWHNARDIPLTDGHFGFDDYVSHIIRFLETMGPDSHVLGVCQPCNALLVSIAAMAQANNPALPRSMTLMAGPVDTSINPTKVNTFATSHSMEWFEKNLITTVPHRFAGMHRRVYPGFIQVGAFLSMNPMRHLRAHADLFEYIVMGEREGADTIRKFYDEYFTVLDLPAEFYLETVARVFQEHQLAHGRTVWQGETINPTAIKRTALLTVEGERDDICSIGQTVAAHDLCTGIKPHKKRHHLQPDVGHYGVFSGRKWQTQIYPIVRDVIRANN